MKGKRRKNILIFFIAIVLIGVITGYMMWNKPHRDVRNATAVATTAVNLYKIFTSDSIRAKATYMNTVVAVSGKVKQVSLNQQHQQVILLETGIHGASVNCTMEENISNVKNGDSITIRGICSGYISGDVDMDLPGDVFVTRCYSST